MKKRIERIVQHKMNLEVQLSFIKIAAPNISDKIDFVDLAIVWQRGPEQSNETKGYELNYIEFDLEMNEVFRRVSGFYSNDKDFKTFNKKMCTFILKEYKWTGDKRDAKGTELGHCEYDMSSHIQLGISNDLPDFSNENQTKSIKTKKIKFPKVKNYGDIVLEFTMQIRETENTENRHAMRQFNKVQSKNRRGTLVVNSLTSSIVDLSGVSP